NSCLKNLHPRCSRSVALNHSERECPSVYSTSENLRDWWLRGQSGHFYTSSCHVPPLCSAPHEPRVLRDEAKSPTRLAGQVRSVFKRPRRTGRKSWENTPKRI